MIKTHKIFLLWLLYATITLFCAGALVYSGIPRLAVSYDHSHLTVFIFLLYLAAEALSGLHAWKISEEHRVSSELFKDLSSGDIASILINTDGSLKLTTDIAPPATVTVPASAIATHIHDLVAMAKDQNGRPIDQRIILECTEETLYENSSSGEFIAERIVWIGIFATILGVIMAFWPLLQSGFDIESMKSNLGHFFGGIAVAFIPTAASFLFKIMLDVNRRILLRGTSETVVQIARIAETKVIPYLTKGTKV